MTVTHDTRTLRVLVINDDQDAYALATDLLSSALDAGYQMDWVASYEDAVQRVRDKHHDVYLVDAELGSHSGLDLVEEARHAGNLAPFIVLTDESNPEADQAAMAGGAADYLVKSRVDPETLDRSIRYAVERSRAAAALEESEARFRSAFDNAPIGIALFDVSGRFLLANEVMFETLWYSAQQLTDLSIEDIIHPDDWQPILEGLSTMLRGEVDTWKWVRRNITGDGRTLTARMTVTLVRNSLGRPLHFLGHWLDISDVALAERRLDELLRAVGHELRTPLQTVVEFAELLRNAGGALSPAEREQLTASIAQRSFELVNMVEDLQVAAQVESGELMLTRVRVDLWAQSAQVLESLAHLTQSPIEITGTRAKAEADPSRVRQILRNLVKNAVELGNDRVLVAVSEGDDHSLVRVGDDAPPIPLPEQDEIFETPLGRPPEEAPARGGLAVGRQLARMMGGDLIYRHEDNMNIFELALPAFSDVPSSVPLKNPPIDGTTTDLEART